MIRRAVISLFLLLTIATLVLGTLSYFVQVQRIRFPVGFAMFHGYLRLHLRWEHHGEWLTEAEYNRLRPSSWCDHRTLRFHEGRLALRCWQDGDPVGPPPGKAVRRCTHLECWAHAPFWMWSAGFASPPVLLGGYPLFRQWRRRKRGLCVKCAYDLTGNVSGVCPECGTEVKKP
jgi:hypothetical protein